MFGDAARAPVTSSEMHDEVEKGDASPATDSTEAARLATLRAFDVLDTAGEPAVQQIADAAAEIAGCPTAAVGLMDHDRLWFKARCGLEVEQTGRDIAFCEYVLRTDAMPTDHGATWRFGCRRFSPRTVRSPSCTRLTAMSPVASQPRSSSSSVSDASGCSSTRAPSARSRCQLPASFSARTAPVGGMSGRPVGALA